MAMKLEDILYKVAVREIYGSTGVEANALCIDSRQVVPQSLFVARRGTITNAHRFIPSAVEKGAVAVVCSEIPADMDEDTVYVCVDDCDQALGIMASNFYGNPSAELRLCGVTGTNGKTTIATLLHQLFTGLGYATGLVSTVRNLIGGKEVSATHTTPDAISLNAMLREMAGAGCTYCFMEVSSHAIHQKRIAGLEFAGGIFTNLTHDHLDYHGDFAGYLRAKKAFFDMLPPQAFALANADDRNAKVMLQNTVARKFTYGLKSPADFNGKLMENLVDGLLLSIGGKEVWSRLSGGFNASNLMAVYAAAVLLEQVPEKVLTLLSGLEHAEGRFETLRSEHGITAIIDYAHTPDALLNVLKAIQAIRTGNEQVITVVGAGGDRDKAKRPLMGSIAAEHSDRLILTSDNPRSEEPQAIIEEIKAGISAAGIKKALVITNRKEAIAAACALAQPGDIILVAGKGHEKYQEIKGIRYPFDDRNILIELLNITA
jgi:UDP-N-acetylmuramoyl-L-alanyl-D-glutamate--2,6-diaminopimelate ligase